MPIARIAEKDLLTAQEMPLFTLSQDSQALAKQSPAQLRKEMVRARNLRDRARTLYRKQTGRVQAATGSKRGFNGMANERSRQKALVLSETVQRLTAAHDQRIN